MQSRALQRSLVLFCKSLSIGGSDAALFCEIHIYARRATAVAAPTRLKCAVEINKGVLKEVF